MSVQEHTYHRRVNKNQFHLFTACHRLLLVLLVAAAIVVVPLIEFFVSVSVKWLIIV